jgi:hypothetical protein
MVRWKMREHGYARFWHKLPRYPAVCSLSAGEDEEKLFYYRRIFLERACSSAPSLPERAPLDRTRAERIYSSVGMKNATTHLEINGTLRS